MTRHDMLRDLFLHQAWADREMLTAIAADAKASEDRRIRDRLHHAHAVQRAFLSLFVGESPDVAQLQEPFASLDQLMMSVNAYHERVQQFVEQRGDADLDDSIDVPWFSDARFSLGEVMLQVVMHSQYHRGQNATALRDLNSDPPLTDFIVWLARDKPR